MKKEFDDRVDINYDLLYIIDGRVKIRTHTVIGYVFLALCFAGMINNLIS